MAAFLALVPIHWSPAGQSSFEERDLNAGQLPAPAGTGVRRVDTRSSQPQRAAATPSAEPRRAHVSKIQSSRVQASKANPGKVQLSKAQSAKTQVAKTRLARAQAAKVHPGTAHATKAQPTKAQASQKAQSNAARKSVPKSAAKSPSSPLKSPAAPKASTAVVRPISGGGYVFPGGRMRIAADARSVEEVHFSGGCAAGTATPPMAVDGHGVFRYTGPLDGAIQVTLVGRFVDRAHAALQIRFKGALCTAELLALTARLS